MVEKGDKIEESAIEKANRIVRVEAWDIFRASRNTASRAHRETMRQADSVHRKAVARAWAIYKVTVDGARSLGDLLVQVMEMTDDK